MHRETDLPICGSKGRGMALESDTFSVHKAGRVRTSPVVGKEQGLEALAIAGLCRHKEAEKEEDDALSFFWYTQ